MTGNHPLAAFLKEKENESQHQDPDREKTLMLREQEHLWGKWKSFVGTDQ